jgi:hypothetical protein
MTKIDPEVIQNFQISVTKEMMPIYTMGILVYIANVVYRLICKEYSCARECKFSEYVSSGGPIPKHYCYRYKMVTNKAIVKCLEEHQTEILLHEL